jgi:hypothetical protein
MARIALALAALLVTGCATVAPVSTPVSVSPGASVPAASAGASFQPVVSPAASPAETPIAVTPEPVAITPSPDATPTKTPKPTRTPKPTPTPIAVDLSMFIYGSDLPSPWYVGTSYTIPFYVVATGADVPNAHVRITIENLTAEFDTGPIATTDKYSRSIDFTLTAAGPTSLNMSVKAPPGYVDTDKSNNKGPIPVDVQPAP